jgi:transcription antitermination protein NusB
MSSGHRGRARARSVAVQALYQWQLGGQDPGDIVREFCDEREVDGVDRDYFETLLRGVIADIGALRELLSPVLGRGYEALDPVERSVLLLGAYELQHHLEVPARVVINEAVELTKVFGGTESHRFINGALDRLAHDIRRIEFASQAR